MKKISLLYISTRLRSIHEYRFLSMLDKESTINLFVLTNTIDDCCSEILELNLKVFVPQNFLYKKGGHVFEKYKNLILFKKLKKIIKIYNIDLIHSGWLTWDSYLAVKTNFHPILAMSWGSDVLPNPFNKNAHNSNRILKRLRYVSENVDAVYSDSNEVGEVLKKLTSINDGKINIFPQLGINIDIFKPELDTGLQVRKKYGIKRDEIVLLCTRNFKHVYAVEDIIRAFSIALQQKSKLKLLLCGDGYLKKHLIKVVSDLRLEKKVTFLGTVPNDKLPAIYNAADIYISTSLSDGTSLSLLEAMSSGKPVIVSDVPSILEWIRDGDNGWVVKKGDIDSIYKAILEASSSKELQLKYGRNNRKIALERIDININFKKLMNLYGNLFKKTEF
jgi:L-malate glycosyltransferase